MFYNQQVVAVYHTLSELFGEAQNSGIMAAQEKYADQMMLNLAALGQYSASATSVCPAFADVWKLDESQLAD